MASRLKRRAAAWLTILTQLDPGQIKNFFTNAAPADSYEIRGRQFKDITPRLDALMMVLKSCKGNTCRNPWGFLHPDGDVQNLLDALSPTFDRFYHEQPKVAFSSCELGYLKAAEGPQHVHTFRDPAKSEGHEALGVQPSFEYRGHWSDWT